MHMYVRTCLLEHVCVLPILCTYLSTEVLLGVERYYYPLHMYLSTVDRLEILEYVKLILSTIATALRGNPANAKHFQENVSYIFLIPIFIYLLYVLLLNSYNLHIK